jgi:hypothetical protein
MHIAGTLLLSGSSRKSEGQVGFEKSTYIFQKEMWLGSENDISCISPSACIQVHPSI